MILEYNLPKSYTCFTEKIKLPINVYHGRRLLFATNARASGLLRRGQGRGEPLRKRAQHRGGARARQRAGRAAAARQRAHARVQRHGAQEGQARGRGQRLAAAAGEHVAALAARRTLVAAAEGTLVHTRPLFRSVWSNSFLAILRIDQTLLFAKLHVRSATRSIRTTGMRSAVYSLLFGVLIVRLIS